MELNININDVSETAFLTLYCHALDAQSKDPILNDRSSIIIMQMLNHELSNSDKNLVVHTAIRAKKYDEYAGNFIKKISKSHNYKYWLWFR